MRRGSLQVILGVCILLITSGLLRAQAAEQVLTNGDFEKGLAAWSVPADGTIDQKVFKTGKQSLRITRAEKEGWSTSAQNAKIEGGNLYRISMWVKLLNVYQTHARLRWYDKNDNLLGAIYPFVGRDGTADWFQLSQVAAAPKDATQLWMELLAGPGMNWFDGISIELVPTGKRIILQSEWPKVAQAKYGPSMIAPPMKEKIAYYDKRYDSSVSNLDTLLRFLNHRGFKTLDADQLKTWMRKKIEAGADGSVCVPAMGYIPDTVGETKDVTCTFRRYLEAGGRIVWIGDVPLFYQSYRDRAFTVWGGTELVLGIKYAMWGDDRSPKITPEGEKWGMRVLDTNTSKRAYLAETTSVAYSAIPDSTSVCSFFVNYNPDYPYSGFVRYGLGFDGKNSDKKEDLYRLALYRGKPIEVPQIPEESKEAAAPEATVETPMTNYPRGWVVPATVKAKAGLKADTVRLRVSSGGKMLKEMNAPFGKEKTFSLKTSDLASREYTLTAELISNGRTVGKATRRICLVAPKTGKFPISAFGVNVPDSEYKCDLILKDLKDHLGECGVTEGEGYFGDTALKYGLRLMAKSNAFYANVLPKSEHPELQMRVSTGELPSYHYSGLGWFAPRCMGNPINRDIINKTFQSEISGASAYPGFMNRMYVSDDGGLFGDPEQERLACYCQYCKGEFKRLTGFDAPLAMPESAKKKGVVSDNDQWYLWMKFRSKNTYGGWNASMEAAKNRVNPKLKFGPIPAGGSTPVLNPQFALNPPDNYGSLGMASYYCYPVFSSCFRFLQLSAQAEMGNREKELWVIAQGCDYGGKMNDQAAVTKMVRSEFYYLLASGAKGITYFLYSGMAGTPAWEEFHKLSKVGTDYGPLMLSLKRAPAKIALLDSYCNTCYGGDGATGSLYYSFARAHVPADLVADEEIAAGRLKNYRVLVLTGADYLTQSVCKKITEFIAGGGIVLKDEASEIDIPGARIVAGDAQIIESSRTIAMPDIEIDTPNLIATQFTGSRARYLMVVNNQTTSTTQGLITLKGMKGCQPYDIFSGKALKPDSQGRFSVNIEQAGGKLIGVYPTAVAGISVHGPSKVVRGRKSSIRVDVIGRDGAWLQSSLPIQLKITDPNGKDTEYSDYRVAENGRIDILFSPAVNDVRGKWKAQVTELSSGASKQTGFVVE